MAQKLKQKQKSAMKLEWIFLAVLIVILGLVIASLLMKPKASEAKELKPGSSVHPHVFSYAPDGETLWIGTHNGIYERTGSKWLSIMPALSSNDVMGLEIDPANPDTIVISGHGFIKRSLDGGKTWNTIENGVPNQAKPDAPDAHQLTMNAANPKQLYTMLAGQGDNVYETKDGGTTWKKAGKIAPDSFSIAAAPDKDNSLLAGSKSGLIRYDFTNGVTQETKLSSEPVYQVLTLPAGDVIVMNEGGFSRSKDMKTWTPLNVDLGGEPPLGIRASRKDPNRLAIVTQSYTVFESADGGQTWAKLK